MKIINNVEIIALLSQQKRFYIWNEKLPIRPFFPLKEKEKIIIH